MGLLLIWSVASIVYVIAVVIYRAFLHPLSRIPGPFLASVTYLYQYYYNIFCKTSSFYLQIEKLHHQYGPVVRISPHEVHLSDPAHHQTIHRVGTKYTKDPAYYQTSFVSSMSMFTTQDNALHRARRSALAPLFTRARVLELEPIVQSKVSKLCKRVQEQLASSQPVDLYHAVRCISLDTITEYAFDNCRNLLDTPDLAAATLDAVKKGQPRLWELQLFPWIVKLWQAPKWVLNIVSPTTANFLARRAVIDAQVRDVERRVNAGEKPADNRRTIFHQLLDPNAGDGHVVPPIEALSDEAGILVAAAGETVGISLTMGFYRVLADETVREKLMAELNAAIPNPEVEMKFAELERLPYLTAVLKESLRLAFPLPGRLPRVVPEGGADFDGYHIPAGMAVSMSQWMQHRNETIFPDPMAFEPGRWLSEMGKGSGGPDDYLIAFGRGSRVCLGMTLAWCELYVTLGTVMRKFGDRLKLSNGISEEDFYPLDDYVTSWPRDDAKKLAVVGK
jgi:cytochrome P450